MFKRLVIIIFLLSITSQGPAAFFDLPSAQSKVTKPRLLEQVSFFAMAFSNSSSEKSGSLSVIDFFKETLFKNRSYSDGATKYTDEIYVRDSRIFASGMTIYEWIEEPMLKLTSW